MVLGMKRDVVRLPSMPGYDDALGLKKIIVEQSCDNCQHSDKRRESVIEYLRARGITQVTDAHGEAVPGQNTIARDFEWGTFIERLDDPGPNGILLCRRADALNGPGSEMVTRGTSCHAWAEDRGRIVVPGSWGKLK